MAPGTGVGAAWPYRSEGELMAKIAPELHKAAIGATLLRDKVEQLGR